MTPNPFGPGGGMFRFEGPILNPPWSCALSWPCTPSWHPRCTPASGSPHEGPPHVSCGEHASESCRGDAPVLRSPCTPELCCIHACGQGQEAERACLPQAIPWRDLFHGNDISTKINFVTSVMFPGIRRLYGSRRSAVLPASFPTLRSMSGTLEIS